MRVVVAFVVVALGACRLGFETGLADASGHDGTVDLDGQVPPDIVLVDGPAGSVTSSWGEDSAAQHRNVTADTYLNSEVEGMLDKRTLNYGASTSFSLESSNRALIRFDLSAIPSSGSVVSATLRLSVNGSQHGPVEFHRLLEAWDEGTQIGAVGDACWNNRVPGVPWTTPGAGQTGSSDAAVQAQIAAGITGVSDLPLPPALVQGWVANPATNFGLAMFMSTGDDFSVVSSEGSDGARPLLIVTYFP